MRHLKRYNSILALFLTAAILLNQGGTALAVTAAEHKSGQESIPQKLPEDPAGITADSGSGAEKTEKPSAAVPEGSLPPEENQSPEGNLPPGGNLPQGGNLPSEGNLPPGDSLPSEGNLPLGDSQSQGGSLPPEGNLPPGDSQPSEDNLPLGDSQPPEENLPVTDSPDTEETAPGDEHVHLYAESHGKLVCSICGEEKQEVTEEKEETVVPPECAEGRSHAYEEQKAEDGGIAGYRCVFCAREIDADTFKAESASLHLHSWERKEGELRVICADCLSEYRDCEAEEGYGIHIYEESETEEGGYRCIFCGEEKKTLDAWEVTAEQFQQIVGIETMLFTYEGETSSLPASIEELEKAQAGGAYPGNVFLVENLADIIALSKLNEDGFTFENYTVNFGARRYDGGSTGELNEWDLTAIKDGDFNGFGTKDYPFKGTLTSYYLSGSLRFKTKVPMLNYAAAGASVSQLQIAASVTSGTGEAAGIIAAHVVPAAGADTITLSNLSLSGTVTNLNGAAGILFGEIINPSAQAVRLRYEDDSIRMEADVTAKYAGGLAGYTEGNVEIYQTGVFPAAKITGTGFAVESGSAAGEGGAGMLVGAMAAAAGPDGNVYTGKLYLDASKSTSLELRVEGAGSSGGLAGRMEQGEIIQNPSPSGVKERLTVTGSVTGMTAGGLAGHCEETKLKLDQITVNANVKANARYGGGVIGHYYGKPEGESGDDFQSLNHIAVNGTISGYTAAGGVAGYVEASNFRIGTADTADCVKAAGAVAADANNGAGAGGVIGKVKGQFVEVYHASVSGKLSNAQAIGGIIGTVGDGAERSVVKVTDASVSSAFAPGGDHKAQGGIFGKISADSMAALDGWIDTAAITIGNTSVKKGHIAGEQDKALVYMESGCAYIRPTGKNWVDDIGTYGGVYKNGLWGESAAIISYTGKDVAGQVGTDGTRTWILDSEGDVLRFAIALNTEGNFAAGHCFSASKSELTGAGSRFILRAPGGELHLEDSGIYSLNANTGVLEADSFQGRFGGETGSPVTLMLGELTTYQSYLSLFPCVKDARLENFRLERTIRQAENAAAGLAVLGKGNLSIENVDAEAVIEGSTKNSGYVYGGMLAEYEGGAGQVLSVKDSRIGGAITILQYGVTGDADRQYAGGMAAKFRQTGGGMLEVDGLSLALSMESNSAFVSGMITQINVASVIKNKKDVVTLKLKSITVKNGARLVITGANRNGGWLGREWYGIAPYTAGTETYSIKELRVGDGGNAADGPYYASSGFFGGLVYLVAGRIRLKDIHIQNGTFNNKSTQYNGLLFKLGHDALVEIEDYVIAGYPMDADSVDYAATREKVAVTGQTGNFSEVMGNNEGVNDNATNDYRTGGVVNLISGRFANDNTPYRNRLLNAQAASSKSRYYYNLFGASLSGDGFLDGRQLDASSPVIADADQMMVWHLTRYMNDSIKWYLDPYYTGGSAAAAAGKLSVTLKGTIDLDHKSYYPTYVTGGMDILASDHAKIIFRGDKIYEKTENAKRPGSIASEHYMMQSGLFLSQEGAVTVDGRTEFLTLSGVITDAGNVSGALFTRTITGNKNIYRIRLEDLFICKLQGNVHDRGLLIAQVNDNSRMDISWIETSYASAAKNAGSALIGTVGGSNAENINIDFSNLKLDYNKNSIFTSSILIDKFDYTDSTEKNKGRVRYLFTEEAYKGTDGTGNSRDPFTDAVHGENDYSALGPYATVGNELKDGVEYWNVDSGPGTGDYLPGTAVEWQNAVWEEYLPYVCHTHSRKDIEVNPKNVSILEGCGTYEDPYQISRAKQILALSRYLKNKDDKKYLEGWQIVKTGKRHNTAANNGVCDKAHGADDYVTYGEPEFPSQEELRQAYYRITEDIDLSSLPTATDKNIAQEFVGLGTADMPFGGVITGKKKADGSRPVITLSKKKTDNSCSNFGLIQYAKGAVVKDVVIQSNPDADDGLTGVVRVTSAGGGVISCILGGDNIIDNVKAENSLAASGGAAAVGGYVGIVEQGSLILRGLSEEGLSGFRAGTLNADGSLGELGGTALKNYPYVSGMVGKVENGFVVYEGGSAAADEVLDHAAVNVAGLYKHDRLPISNTYDILNASALSAAGRIEINGAGDAYTCEIMNAGQLQLVSMAINSDAFSVYYDAGGYDAMAVCRKADYAKVGEITGADAADAGYRKAVDKDDAVYWYPYIYQYFNFNGVSSGDSREGGGPAGFYDTLQSYTSGKKSAYRSRLNAVDPAETAKMTYKLKDDTSKDITYVDYDLSVYKRSFRGLGATYRVFKTDAEKADLNSRTRADGIYSDFRADFDGSGATVKAVMLNDYDKTIHTTALFNDLVNTETAQTYSIRNLAVTGSFVNTATIADAANYSGDRAAAVAGLIGKPWTFSHITAFDIRVSGKGHTGGIAAWIDPKRTGKEQSYVIENTRVLSKSKDNASLIQTEGGSCGGILGIMAGIDDGTRLEGISLTLNNCYVQGERAADGIHFVTVQNDAYTMSFGTSDQERSGRGRSGAMIGHVGNRVNYWSDKWIKVEITGNAADEEIKYVSISGSDSTGGILGEYYGRRSNDAFVNVSIKNMTVSDSRIECRGKNETGEKSFGVGGMLGKLQRTASCRIDSSEVKNTDIRSVYHAGMDMNAGGLIGFCYGDSRVTLTKTSVTGDLSTAEPAYGITAKQAHTGGLIGSFGMNTKGKSTLTVTDCLVSGMNISSDSRSDTDIKNDKASGVSDSRAGGLIGTVANTSVKIAALPGGYNEVTDCVIRSGKNSAAGAVGTADENTDMDLEGVKVSRCIIGGNTAISAQGECGYGGLIGKLRATGGIQKFKNLRVEDCDIYGKYSGGLIGYVESNQKLGNIYRQPGDEIKISNSRILGYIAGGAIGWDDSTKEAFTDTEIEKNTIVALRNHTGEFSMAGGFCGYKKIAASNEQNLDYIKITDNRILVQNAKKEDGGSAGGMFGRVEVSNYLYAFKPVLTDNVIGYCELTKTYKAEDLLSSQVAGHKTLLLAAMQEASDAAKTEVSLWKQGLLGLSRASNLPGGLKEEDIGDYALLFGNLVGNNVDKTSRHIYFIAPQITYTDAYGDKIRPVVDVGADPKDVRTAGSKLLSYPYQYREDIHVIYFEPDTGGTNTAAAVWGNSDSEKDRLFSQIPAEALLEEYKTASGGTDTGKLLEAYRLSLTDDTEHTVSGIFETVYKNASGDYLSPLKIGAGGMRETLPMIVADTQYGTIDQLMTSVLAALTGAGGIQNSGEKNKNADYDKGMARIISASVKAMKVEGGVIKEAAESASIKCGKQNDRVEIAYNGYDMATEEGDGTFSLLTITYGKSSYELIDGTKVRDRQAVLHIPIFVIERLTMDTHLKIVEGEVYNVDSAKEKGLCTTPLLANNSSYTLYTEYIYGEARNKYSTDASPVRVDKTIGMTYTDEKGNAKRDNFWKGTRLTLIDVCDSNKVYYYTVTGGETEILKYTDFKDSQGNPYVNKPIHGNTGMEIYKDADQFVTEDAEKTDGSYKDKTYEYENVAVERFLIVVDTSQVEESLKLNTKDIRDYSITPQLGEEVKKRTTLSEHTNLQITRQPGLTVALVKSGKNASRIDGKIEDGEKVTVDGVFHIEGDNAYWARVMNNQTATIDSANHYKYLELGIYLTDKNGERVRLPDNTNVTIGGNRLEPLPEETTPERPLGPYVNQNAVYFYKDGRVFFPMDDLKQLIAEEIKASAGRTNGVITISNQVTLSFANADLADYTEDGYVVHLELLRVEEPDYPAGGEVIDFYEDTCPAARKTDLACALETKDLMQLGINIYEQQTKMPHLIEFDFKLDFNGILSNSDIANQQLADKYYTVTYRIWEKTNRSGIPQYVPYTGDELTLELVSPSAGERLKKGISSAGDNKNSVYASYHFTLKEILEGSDGISKGVITRKLNLAVEDAGKMDLSNYKVQASVMVSDLPAGDIDAAVNQALTDFFVFTVAKLKTDLDY